MPDPVTIRDSCETCRYFWPLKWKTKFDGECRRFPPQFSWLKDIGGDEYWYGMQPCVEKDGYCGEYVKASNGKGDDSEAVIVKGKATATAAGEKVTVDDVKIPISTCGIGRKTKEHNA